MHYIDADSDDSTNSTISVTLLQTAKCAASLIAYMPVACSCSVPIIVEVDWPH